MWDAHAHPDLMSVQGFMDDVATCLSLGVRGCLAAGTDAAQLEKLKVLCHSSPSVTLLSRSMPLRKASLQSQKDFQVFPAFGAHPWFYPIKREACFESYLSSLLDQITQGFQSAREMIWAVGEIGFDHAKSMESHYRDRSLRFQEAREVQRAIFTHLSSLAAEEGLPLVVHSRGAAAETVACAKEAYDRGVPAILYHCYPYSYEVAKQLMDLGMCFFSFGGVLTWERARKVRQTFKKIPLSHILLETDAPDMPVELHGARKPHSAPSDVLTVCLEAQHLRGLPRAELVDALRENFLFFLRGTRGI